MYGSLATSSRGADTATIKGSMKGLLNCVRRAALARSEGLPGIPAAPPTVTSGRRCSPHAPRAIATIQATRIVRGCVATHCPSLRNPKFNASPVGVAAKAMLTPFQPFVAHRGFCRFRFGDKIIHWHWGTSRGAPYIDYVRAGTIHLCERRRASSLGCAPGATIGRPLEQQLGHPEPFDDGALAGGSRG